MAIKLVPKPEPKKEEKFDAADDIEIKLVSKPEPKKEKPKEEKKGGAFDLDDDDLDCLDDAKSSSSSSEQEENYLHNE